MKTYKKILGGLAALVVLSVVALLPTKPAAAAIITSQAQDCANNLVFVDIAHIQCSVDGFTLNFLDPGPTDTTVEYTASASNPHGSTSSAFCSNVTDFIDSTRSSSFTLTDAGTPQKVNIDIGEANPKGPGCTHLNGSYPVGSTANIARFLQGGNNSAGSLPGVSDNGSLNNLNYSRYANGSYDLAKGPALLISSDFNLNACTGSILAVELGSDLSSGDHAIEYEVKSGGNTKLSSFTDLANLPSNTCGVNSKFDFGLSNTLTSFLINPKVSGLTVNQTGTTCDPSKPNPNGYVCHCVHDESGGLNCTLVASGTGNTGGTTDTSTSCTDDKSLAWLVCPVVTGLSKSADFAKKSVADQLNFNVQGNLDDSVHKAWTIFRTLTSIILVIVMLVMVFSQAVGGGPFDAYTVRKMLPKLVAAIILMQISWPICIYFIGLANDAGQAIGQLMSVPFGGPNGLELGALLTRWSGTGGSAIGALSETTLLGGLLASGALITWGWPIMLLAIILVLIAVLVALAILLIRNALIVLLVMTAPLAFIAFVMPGADRYWKMWKDNFIRVLVFFPLVIGLIYAGRIFAWIVAGLQSPGEFDLIMILAGFFGPYFFLPKTFKWAGPGVAAAANAISNSFPVKKSREVAGRELLARQREKQKELVDKYYSSLVWGKNGKEGKQADMGSRVHAGLKRGFIRSVGGYPVPTKRQTEKMMQEVGKWKADEIALREEKMNNDYKEYQRRLGVPGAKKAVRDKYYDPTGKNGLGNRAFFTWAYDTKSFMEMGDTDWRTGEGKHEDMFKTQGWIDFMHGNSNAYSDFSARLGASAVPFRLPLGGGPKTEHYLRGGKRYNILNYADAPETDDDGNVVTEGGKVKYAKDADGNRVKNVYYNPGLKRMIDANPNSPEVHHLAELAADSERFTKLISQSDDPATVVSQRPEEFQALAKMTAELNRAGLESPGQISLKQFIDEQSQTLAGRNVLQRLTTSASPFIDAMMGQKNYVQNKLHPTAATAEAGELVQPIAQQTAAQPQAQPIQQVQPTAQAAAAGIGTTRGGVNFHTGAQPIQPGVMGPIEVKIDHSLANAIGESVREASEFGTHRGMQRALREAGLHRGGSGLEDNDDAEPKP